MNRRTFALLTAVLTFSVGIVLARLSLPNPFKTPPPVITLEIVKQVQLSNYRLSGPYEFDNLKIFLIHAPDTDMSVIYTALQDAMARKIVLVHETENVNELAIENISPFEEVFVQAGDVVKGGKQDRVLAVDLILPAKSGVIPISAFCVEQSRWQGREGESAGHFTLTEMAATSSLRQVIVDVATKVGVWNEVESSQDKLTLALPKNIRSAESPTSLPLALENDTVRAIASYTNNLYPVPDRSNDAIGFAFAINDEIKGADVYSSNMMFKHSWYRLLEAAAVEAVATPRPEETRDCLSIETVGEFLTAAELGAETQTFVGDHWSEIPAITKVSTRTLSIRRETENSLFFETRDDAYGGAWVHRSYLKRILN
jgi:hypothetical protein